MSARIAIALVIVLLPGLLLAPTWRVHGLGAGEDDIMYYYPLRVFFHDTVTGGDWPWLNPWTGLGRPCAADPQAAVWYPPTWLFAVLPPLWAYPLVLWLHYSLAIWGAYRLGRSFDLGRRAALFGGIAFAFAGFMLAHRVHASMQHAAAWTPWVFWCLHQYMRSGPARSPAADARNTRRLVAAAVIIALQCYAGHVQIAALNALGTLVFCWAYSRGPQATRGPYTSPTGVLGRWTVAHLCAAGLFALQWLPALEYVRRSTRLDRGYIDFTENSWFPSSVINWVLPMVFGQRTPNFFDVAYWGPSHQVEQFAYMGILPLLLALLALRLGWRADARRRAWVLLAAFALLLALGIFGPICPILYWLPGANVFRVPARALLHVNLAVAMLAAISLHDLGPQLSPGRARLRAAAIALTRRPILLSVAIIGGAALLVALVLPWLSEAPRAAALRALRPWAPTIWVPLVVTLVSLLVLRLAARRFRRPELLWLVVLVMAVDLGIIGWTIDVPAGWPRVDKLLTPQDAAWMDRVRGSGHRLWVVNARHGNTPGEYVDPLDKAVANTNILHGIHGFTDYNSIQPRALVQRFGFATWGESWQQQALLKDTRWLRLCNIGWVLVCDVPDLVPADCELVATPRPGWRLYRYPHADGFALLDDPAQPGGARLERHGPNAFSTRVDTWPSRDFDFTVGRRPDVQTWPRLVASQLALPGWHATLGGRHLHIETVDGVLMAVRVPPGMAVTIEWAYFPPGLASGAWISGLCAVVLAGAWLWTGRRARDSAARGPRM